MSTLWDQTLAELRLALPNQEFATWISCLRPTVQGHDAITVEAPNVFHRNWVHRNFLETIRSTVEILAGHPIPVALAVSGERATRPDAPARPPRPIRVPANAAVGVRTLTFDGFVVGGCNQVAYGAARAVAEAPGRQFNPLFLHGGVGLGKTHLLHAMANDIRVQFRQYRVLAINAELFLNEMVHALRRQLMESFHQRFRKIDVLLVDDVQFIAGKERTQEEFLHTFNLLCAAGKQIVVTSDQPPRSIPNLEAGLRSRFEGGMIAELTQPDRETRRRILESKARRAGIELPLDVLTYLAERIRAASVRELEGALTRLRAVASVTGRAIDLGLAREIVGPMYAECAGEISAERVEGLVGSALKLAAGELRSAQRSARVVFARQIAMYLMRKQIGLSLAAIGEHYGRDHTTVLHAVRSIEARRAGDPEVRRLVTSLEEKL